MAKQLNKKLVIALTIGGMVVTTIAGVVMVATLPEKDPRYYITQAQEASEQGEHLKASRLYARAWKVSNDARYLVECGQEALDSGDAFLARKVWTDAITNNPKLESAHQKIVELNLEIAKLARNVGAWEQVNNTAESLLNINPKNSVGLHARGLSRLGLRSVKDGYEKLGLDDLTEAQKLAPENPEYAASLAQYYEDRAGEAESSAAQAEAEARRLESLGQREAAMAKRADARQNQEEAARYYDQADHLYRGAVEAAAKNAAAVAKAAAATTQPASESPADKEATARRYYGVFLVRRAFADSAIPEAQQRARLDQGLAEIQKAAELAPQDVDSYLALGNYWIQREQAERRMEAASSRPAATTQGIRDEYFKNAEKALVKAIEVAPNDYGNYLALGMLYTMRGEPQRATEVYDQRLDRAIVRASFMRWQDRHYKLVLLDQAFRTVLQQLTGRPEDKETDQAFIAKAEDYYRKVVAEAQAGEGDPAALAMKGRIEAVRGNNREAIRTLELAQKRLPPNHPAMPEIRFALGELYVRVGETGAAERALQDVVDRYPENDEAWARLATVLYANRNPRGVQAAEQALRLNPNNQTAMVVMREAYTQDRNWDKVAEIQKRLQAGQPEDSDAVLLQRARQALLETGSGETPDAEKLALAKRSLRAIVDKNPTNLTALMPLLQLLARENQHDEVNALMDKALAAAEASTAENRKELEQNLRLLKVSVSTDKPEEKEKATEELIRKGDYESEFARELDFIQFYLRTNDTKQAIEHAKKAIAMEPKDPSVNDVLFRLAVTVKDDALAKETVNRAAQYDLDGAQGRFFAGRLALANNEFERAIQEFRAGLELSGTSSLGQALLGRALLAAGRYDEAEKAFAAALDINPNSGMAVLGLAQLADFRNRPEAARYLARAKVLAPNDPWVLQKTQEEEEAKDPEKAIAAREKDRKAMPSDPEKIEPAQIANLVRLAGLYGQAKPPRYDKAEEVLKEALEKTVTTDRLRSRTIPWMYATLLRERSDKPAPERGLEILKSFVETVKDKNEKASAQILVAQHLQEWARLGLPKAPAQADIDAAYAAAAAIDDSFEVLMGAGTWYRQTGRARQAEEFYRKAAEKAAGGPEAETRERSAKRFLIDTLVESRDVDRRTEVDAAIADYTTRYPDDPVGWLFQGQHDIACGRENEAISAFSKSLEKNPSSIVAYFRRAQVYFLQGRWESAINDLQKAKAIDSAALDFDPRLLLANALVRNGQPDAAINELEGVLKEDPNAEGIARNLVALYDNLKRPDQAEAKALAFRQQYPMSAFWPFRLGHLAERRAKETSDPVRKTEYYRKAAEHYRASVDLSKFIAEPVSQFLRALMACGDYSQVIEFVTKTLPPDKKTPDHSVLLATAYVRKGQREQAEKEFISAMNAARGNAMGLRMVVEAMLLGLGAEPAMKVVQARIAGGQDWVDRYALAVLKSREAGDAISQNRPDEAKTANADAEKALREAIALAKEERERFGLMRMLAQFLHGEKRFEEAAKVNVEILGTFPNDFLTLNNLAYMLMTDLQRPKESLEYAKRAMTVAGTNPNVLDTYGWNLSLLGRYEDAMGPLTYSLILDAENASANYHRAFTCKKLADAKQGNPDRLIAMAKTNAQRAFVLAARNKDADTVKLAGALLKELGITPPEPKASAEAQ